MCSPSTLAGCTAGSRRRRAFHPPVCETREGAAAVAGGWTESGHRETSEKGSSPRKLPRPVGAHRVTERQPQTLAWLLCPKQPPPLSLQVSTQGCPSRGSQGAQQQGMNRLGAVCSGWAWRAAGLCWTKVCCIGPAIQQHRVRPWSRARPAWRLWLLVNQMQDCSPLCAQGPRNPQPWLEAGEWQPGAQGRCWAEAGGGDRQDLRAA